MFNRYWREYPVFLQLILLMLLVYIMMSFSSVIIIALTGKLYGVSAQSILSMGPKSSSNLINAGRFFQLVGNLLTFLATALLFANFTHPKPLGYLGFHKPANHNRFLIVALLAIAFIPLAEQAGTWMRLLHLGQAADAAQHQQDENYKAFLHMNTPWGLTQVLFIMALLPAVGEELFFRGIVMRYAYKGTRNMGLAIFISAALFSFAHSTVYNFPSILAAGILLGYIYYATGSIWFSILFHFLNNGIQIVMEYLSQHKMLPAAMQDMKSYPAYVVLIALAIAAVAIWLLKKKSTPLPPSWGVDFDLPEVAGKEEEQQNV